MPRRSLKPQLNQIRTWVRQGRTDAWIAHQLEVSIRDISAFKRDHELAPADAGDEDGPPPPEEELDLRAEDDALVAAALDSEPEEEQPAEAEEPAEDESEKRPARRRRGRRGGRGRRSGGSAGPLDGTFDHGEEGYGLWLDPAVQDDAVYAEHWAGHRTITVTIEPDQIVIRRANGDGTAPDPDDFE